MYVGAGPSSRSWFPEAEVREQETKIRKQWDVKEESVIYRLLL